MPDVSTAFTMVVIGGAGRKPLTQDCCAVPGMGVMAVSDALAGTVDIWLAEKCASLAVETIASACGDSVGTGALDGPARLRASILQANRKVREAVLSDPTGRMNLTSVSLAASVMTDRGVFVAWAGRRTRVNRVRPDGYDVLTPTTTETLSLTEARLLPPGAVVVGPNRTLAFNRDLGPFTEPPIQQGSHPIRAGELIVASHGWLTGNEPNERAGEEFLSFLSMHTERLDLILEECTRNTAWQQFLPAPVIRCSRDLG